MKRAIGLSVAALLSAALSTAFGQATLPASYSGTWSNSVLPAGWSSSGLGTEYSGNYDGAGGNAGKLDTSGDYIQVNYDAPAGEVTYWIANNGTTFTGVLTMAESTDGSAWTPLATYTVLSNTASKRTNTPAADSRYLRLIYTAKTNGNVGFDGISVTALGATGPTNLQFSTSTSTVAESVGTLDVQVVKSITNGTVTAEIRLGGTAAEGADYTLSTTNISLSGAAMTQTVTITVADDAAYEAAETAILSLTNISGGTLVSPATFTLTINNNDALVGAVSNVWINEINYDPAGTDSNEFVEVAGLTGTDLSGYSLVMYNGGNGLVTLTTNLSGTIVEDHCGLGAVAVAVSTMQNGPDGVALVQGATVLQFLGYEGTITASNGPAVGMTSAASIGTQNNFANTLQLGGTGTNYGEFSWTTNTPSPGLLNAAQYITGCSSPGLTLAFSPAAYTAGEASVSFDVLVYKSAAVSNVTAQLVPGGTAAQGADYTLSTTNISLTGATTSQLVTITIVNDSAPESNETVVLSFTNIVDAGTGAPASHTLTITDDDQLSLVITTAAQAVQNDIATLDVGGTANAVIVGELVWSNQLTGATGTTPAGATWLVSALPLGVGPNVILVTATNALGNSTQASRTITRLDVPRAGTSTILVQDFEATDTWSIVAGAAQVSANTGAADFPDGQRIFNGVQSWQVNNASVTLELAQASIAGFTGRQVNVRISSTAFISSQGADASDRIRLLTALDGAAFSGTADLDLTGNNNARWGFWATNHAAVAAGTGAAVQAPQGGQSTNHYSDLYVLLPDGATSLAVRVVALNDSTNEFWSVDAVRVTGYAGVNPDADGDTLPDAWELESFGSTTNGAAGDVDGDGFSNLDEYIAGTHPTNGMAYLELTGLTNAPAAAVSFVGVTGRLYMVDRSDSLLDGAGWVEFTNNIAGTNGVMRIPDGGVTNNRSYRLRVRLQ